MLTGDFLYTDIRFRWKMNGFLLQNQLVEKKTHKEIIYVSDINKNLNHCAQSLKRQYLGQQ